MVREVPPTWRRCCSRQGDVLITAVRRWGATQLLGGQGPVRTLVQDPSGAACTGGQGRNTWSWGCLGDLCVKSGFLDCDGVTNINS